MKVSTVKINRAVECPHNNGFRQAAGEHHWHHVDTKNTTFCGSAAVVAALGNNAAYDELNRSKRALWARRMVQEGKSYKLQLRGDAGGGMRQFDHIEEGLSTRRPGDDPRDQKELSAYEVQIRALRSARSAQSAFDTHLEIIATGRFSNRRMVF